MSYQVVLSEQAHEYIEQLDGKSARICRDNLAKLEQPYPGRGPGDKERVSISAKKLYRLHIGRSHTAIYDVVEEHERVYVLYVLDIDDAHKRYD